MKAIIALEDGTIIPARSFTGAGEALGEMVFNTSMSGYQEILSDPSSAGQLVTMTYPLIGNSGVNPQDMESDTLHPRAFLVRQYQPRPSNYRSTGTLADLLKKFGVLGVEGFDTRMLARKLRSQGAMKAVVSTDKAPPEALVERARQWPGMAGQDMAALVTCREPYIWTGDGAQPGRAFPESPGQGRFKVLVYDFGVKRSQLRLLLQHDCRVLVVPAGTKAEEALALQPDGIFLSNGPGDPAGVAGVQDEVKKLIGKVPIFGICLGHQIIALALGAKTCRLKFGHRGGNQPVKNLATDRVEITSQNQGFCVDRDTLPEDVAMTHVNLNDGSLEGLQHRTLPVFSVQYHPESATGPHDARYLFARFIGMIRQTR
ncbi:glutamine-hydrolyzing carbamoyl-phosphate synthase small subunit [Desulfobulbus oralis]|uniref:Carbamoyl phosphate synthase small chain n=1 Tax=Desulfobulbus oralis TaxID=1986146 RepID=A0A2L1GQI5_9BACT|nr:glutamine-hydrolyzing carbamoyl-phosphate synthase small subunit [Desulfobulbus oralis]AVD71943.1 carbamoyl phosphate synthase small subunit [Desulfobulbus oralis]